MEVTYIRAKVLVKLLAKVPNSFSRRMKLLCLENKNDNNFVNESYLFTQISTTAKTYTITVQEPSIYV